MARYEGDRYYATTNDVPGNPWFICTLWIADFLAQTATDEQGTAEAIDLMMWVAEHALPSGCCRAGASVHGSASFRVTPHLESCHLCGKRTRVLARLGKIKMCPECGLALTDRSPKEHWIDALYGEACDEIYGMCEVS